MIPHQSNTRLLYKSKPDLLYLSIIIFVEMAILVAVYLVLSKGETPFNLFLGAIICLIGIGSAWLFFGVRYYLNGRTLELQMGPFRKKIFISEIRSVSEVRSLLSSWAVSVNRLKIRTRRGSIEISPINRAQFIRALCEKNSNIKLN